MSNRWQRERKRDPYYRRAKREKYRSRAAYKLIQINNKFNIIKSGDAVIDLGASPGGWSQIAAELVGERGRVIALDIKPIDDIKGVIVLRGDAKSPGMRQEVSAVLGGGRADAVISDMSPNISGNYSMDHARSIELAEMALEYANEFLRPGRSLLVKVFDGDLTNDLFNNIKSRFKITKRHAPKASRKSSSELYLIGMGFVPGSDSP
jgi:23S rRNA (uridine2552-2'-O)-methyltransferase